MHRTVTRLSLTLLLTLLAARPASALLPWQRDWEEKYVKDNKDAKFVEAAKAARCNVCHDANSKTRKDKNDYGKAVGKFITKSEFDMLKKKKDDEGAKKYVLQALEKAEAEKGADGKTYGDKIKAGLLPSQ